MKVRLLKEAEAEVAEAAQRYEDNRPGLGAEFLATVDQALRSLGEHPQWYSVLPKVKSKRQFRRTLLKRFPYKIIFEIRPEEIVVMAVSHNHRHPTYWESRNGA